MGAFKEMAAEKRTKYLSFQSILVKVEMENFEWNGN